MSDTSRYIPEHRRQQHKGKNQFRGDELRRRREDQQVEIRKQKKEENLAKRRNLETKIQDWDGGSGDTSESDDENGVLNRKVSSASSHQKPKCETEPNDRSWRNSHRWSLVYSPILSRNSSARQQNLEKFSPRN